MRVCVCVCVCVCVSVCACVYVCVVLTDLCHQAVTPRAPGRGAGPGRPGPIPAPSR